MRRGAKVEHLDVVVIGAGLSGIGAGHYLQTLCPRRTYAILEQRDRIGGTWDLFRYPGIRSDSDMFTMGYSFRPWTKPKAISPGSDIRDYVEATARDVCPPAAADRFIEKSRMIAQSLEMGIATSRGVMLAPGERLAERRSV